MEYMYRVFLSKSKVINEIKNKIKCIPGIETKTKSKNIMCSFCNDKRIFKTIEALNQHSTAKHFRN